MPTKSIELTKTKKISMHRNSVKKDGKNGQLDCGIHSSPAAADLLCKVRSAIARHIVIVTDKSTTHLKGAVYVSIEVHVAKIVRFSQSVNLRGYTHDATGSTSFQKVPCGQTFSNTFFSIKLVRIS